MTYYKNTSGQKMFDMSRWKNLGKSPILAGRKNFLFHQNWEYSDNQVAMSNKCETSLGIEW